MRLRTANFLLGALLMGSTQATAQITSVNPLEWAALAEGNELINGQVQKEIDGQRETAILQNTIAAEFTQIQSWQQKYNAYLKTAWRLSTRSWASCT